MSTKTRKGRARVAALAVMAIVASLLVIPLPAGAATGDVEAKAKYTACVEGAVPAAGFSDVVAADYFAKAVDCIKYYGITAGTSATTYGSTQNVSRGQMAVFLTKLAALAGVTMPTGADQGFTDIADQIDVFKTAINQAKQLGITAGKSATTYAPNDPVTRWEMAIFIQKTLSLIVPGPGGATLSGKVGVDGTSSSGFTDIGGVIASAFNAIEDIYDLGVASGVAANTYGPFQNVNRGQMAVFLTQALGHTNVRPAGVTMQAKPLTGFGAVNTEVVLSYRDTAFKPATNVLIDVFSKTVDTGTELKAPLKADGTCDGTQSGDCTIALTDFATNSQGNVVLNQVVASGKTTQWWGWTGSTGATFDLDTVKPGTVTVASTTGAASVVASWSIPANAAVAGGRTTAKFGTVTYTFQLNSKADGTGSDVKQADQTITYSYTLTTATGVETKTNQTVKTDANGTATVSFTATDPNAAAGDTATLDITAWSGPGAIPVVPDMVDEDVAMTDAAAAATTATIKSAAKYVILSASNTGSNSVTAAVYDQYGVGVANQSITFGSSAGAASTINGLVRVTGPDGTVTQGYGYTGVAVAETVTATTSVNDPTATPLWVTAAATGDTAAAAAIQVVDTATDTIVAGLKAWKYDSNDQFNHPGATPVAFATFETDLDAATVPGATITVNPYSATTSAISVWTLLP